METKKIAKLSRVNREKTKVKKKFKINWLLIFAIICLAIPTSALVWVLYTAQLETQTPQIGDRFNGDFAYEINESDLGPLKSSLQEIGGIEDITISMRVATLRIYIDVTDSLDEKRISEIAVEAYEKVNEKFPIATYFSNREGDEEGRTIITQYDLEIYVYNNMEFTDNFIYFRLVKNSASETYNVQNVGKPLDPALAERLRNAEQTSTDGQTGLESNDDVGDDEVIGDD